MLEYIALETQHKPMDNDIASQIDLPERPITITRRSLYLVKENEILQFSKGWNPHYEPPERIPSHEANGGYDD